MTKIILACVFFVAAASIIFFRALLPCKKNKPTIVIEAKNCADSLELIVRDVIKKFPDSEIIVSDKCSDDDTNTIIRILCSDYPCLHIKKQK